MYNELIKTHPLKRFIKSRWFAILMMIAAFVAVVAVCFTSLRIVFVQTETGTMTILTEETEPGKILDNIGIKLSDDHNVNVNENLFYDEIIVLNNNQDENEKVVPAINYQRIPSPVETNAQPSVWNYNLIEKESEPIIVLSADAYLSNLTVDKCKLSPAFNRDTFEYSITVDNDIKSVNVTAQTSNEKATVQIAGGDNLKVGKNAIKITVTAEDGVTIRTYSITVTRKEAEIQETQPQEQPQTSSTPQQGTPQQGAVSGKTNHDYNPISELEAPTIYVDDNGQPLEYKKLYTGKCTAYYNPNGNLTASGRKFMPGHIAVNPKQIPYGTKMYVVSPSGEFVYGYCIAADTGGFATNGSGTLVDLAFWTRSECYNFGRRTMNVYVLE